MYYLLSQDDTKISTEKPPAASTAGDFLTIKSAQIVRSFALEFNNIFAGIPQG